MDRTQPISLWDRTSEEVESEGAPITEEVIDVAIVGGGYTGLSTALHSAQKGLSAHVIEARHIGYGGSGRNAGLVNAAAWLPPTKVRKALGPTYGERFLRRFSDGPFIVFGLIEKYQIRCEATRTGTIHAAHASSGLVDLKSRYEEWKRMGEPVDLLTAEEVTDLVGAKVFHGGLLDHRAGTINPMGYCRGLARAATAAGAKITTGLKVTSLEQDSQTWRVHTPQGALRARAVVLGTNAYTDALWPGLNCEYSTINYLQLATSPLGADAAHILPGRQGVWDTGKIMFSLRRDGQDRLVIGTMGRVLGTKNKGVTRRWAMKRLEQLFPELGRIQFEDAWHGQIAMTPEHLPRVHQLAPGLWTAIGYNGRGIITGTLFGIAIADLLTGMDPSDLPIPLSEMSEAPYATWASRFYDLAFTSNQVWKSLT